MLENIGCGSDDSTPYRKGTKICLLNLVSRKGFRSSRCEIDYELFNEIFMTSDVSNPLIVDCSTGFYQFKVDIKGFKNIK
ncbi:MAG: hypothetical protein ABIB79_02630 [archaeon]